MKKRERSDSSGGGGRKKVLNDMLRIYKSKDPITQAQLRLNCWILQTEVERKEAEKKRVISIKKQSNNGFSHISEITGDVVRKVRNNWKTFKFFKF